MNAVRPVIAIVGGGAAGFFAAINIDHQNSARIIIIEKSNKLLSKVKISGGGRCNVTHNLFETKELVQFYPRGKKELRGPFSTFQPADTFQWFSERGVDLKIESDNRVFPTTDNSQTIIDCFLRNAESKGVEIRTQTALHHFKRDGNAWELQLSDGSTIRADYVLIAAGSSPQFWEMLNSFGLTMKEQIPSLFTFNIKDARLEGLAGLSVTKGTVHIPQLKMESNGPILITHWGLSGPGILKLSSIAAVELHRAHYLFSIVVNWTELTKDEAIEFLKNLRRDQPKKGIFSFSPFEMPLRLWTSIISGLVNNNAKWADMGNNTINKIAESITECRFQVEGKSTFKDEFVTAGGVDLKEIDFKTMQAKRYENLYFAGEVLDIDALTGGFNFQAAWTTSWIAASHISAQIKKTD